MKTSVAAIKVLEEQGAKFVFGIPGGQTLYFTDALRKSNIRFIQTRHEGVAAVRAAHRQTRSLPRHNRSGGDESYNLHRRRAERFQPAHSVRVSEHARRCRARRRAGS